MKSHNKPSKTIVAGKLIWDQCGHCKALIPEWNKMKQSIRTLSKKTPGIFYRFVEIKAGEKEQDHINIINNKYLKDSEEKLAVQGGYPTVFKIDEGKLKYFNGGSRTAEELKNFYLADTSGGNQEEQKQQAQQREEVVNKLDNASIEKNKVESSPKTSGFMDKLRSFFGGKKSQKRRNRKNKKTQKRR